MVWRARTLVVLATAILIAVQQTSGVDFYGPDDPFNTRVSNEEGKKFITKLYARAAGKNNIYGANVEVGGESSEPNEDIEDSEDGKDIETNEDREQLEDSNSSKSNGTEQAQRRSGEMKGNKNIKKKDKLERSLKKMLSKFLKNHFKSWNENANLKKVSKYVKKGNATAASPAEANCIYKTKIKLKGKTNSLDFHGIEIQGSANHKKSLQLKVFETVINKLNENQTKSQNGNTPEESKKDKKGKKKEAKVIKLLINICPPDATGVGWFAINKKPLTKRIPKKPRTIEDVEIQIDGKMLLANSKLLKNLKLKKFETVQLSITKAFGSKDLDVEFEVSSLIQQNIGLLQKVAGFMDKITERFGYNTTYEQQFKTTTHDALNILGDLHFYGSVSAIESEGEKPQVHLRIAYKPVKSTLKIPTMGDKEVEIKEMSFIVKLNRGEFVLRRQANKDLQQIHLENQREPADTKENIDNGTIGGITIFIQTDTDLLTLDPKMAEVLTEYFPIDTTSWCILVAGDASQYFGQIRRDIIYNCLNNIPNSPAPANTQPTPDTFVNSIKFNSPKKGEPHAPPPAPAPAEKEKLAAGFYLSTIVDLTGVAKKCYGDDNILFEKGKTTFSSHQNERRKPQVVFKHPIQLAITKEQVSIRLPQGSKKLSDLARFCLIGIFVNAPSYLTNGALNIDEFVYNFTDKTFTFGVSVGPELTIEPTALTIGEFKFRIERKKVRGMITTEYKGTAKVELGSAKLQLKINYVGGAWIVNIAADAFTLDKLLPDSIKNEYVTKIFEKTGIQNFDLNYEKRTDAHGGAKETVIAVRGQPLFLGFDDLYINAKFYQQDGGHFQIAIGVYLASADFTSIMKLAKGEDDDSGASLSFLKGLQAVVAYNHNFETIQIVDDPWTDILSEPTTSNGQSKLRNVERPGKNFTKTNHPTNLGFPGFKFDVKLKRGEFGFGLLWTVPSADGNMQTKECKESSFCRFLATYASNMSLSIKATVSSSSFKLAATIGGIFLVKPNSTKYSLVYLNGVGLSIRVGGNEPPAFELTATMEYAYFDETAERTLENYSYDEIMNANPTCFKFTGAVEITPAYIKLKFTMSNFVTLGYFAFGNLQLQLGITFAGGLPTFAFGATILFGSFDGVKPETNNLAGMKKAYPNAILITGYIGINPTSPTLNYYYGFVNELTLRSICEAFDVEDYIVKVPDFIKDSGFSSETTISFTLNTAGVAVEGTDIYIRPGIFVEGTFNFLGFEMYARVEASRTAFSFHIETSPIDWVWGLIQVYRDSNMIDGPIFSMSIGSNPSLNATVYVNALGLIKSEATISLGNYNLMMKLNTTLLDLFRVEFTFSLQKIPFELSANVIISSFKDWVVKQCMLLVKGLLGAVRSIASGITIAAVTANKGIINGRNEVEEWNTKVATWREKLKKKKEELEKDTATDEAVCACDEVCVPFLTVKWNCIWLWVRYLPCPWPDPCYSKILDPICVIACTAKKAWSSFVKWGKRTLLEIELALSDGANALLGMTKGLLEALQGFSSFIEEASTYVDEGATFLENTAQNGMDAFIQNTIDSIELSAQLTQDFSACVGYKIGWRGDEPSEGEVCLNIISMVTTFVNMIVGKSTLRNNMTSIETKIPEYEKKAHEVKSEYEEIEKQRDQTLKSVTNGTAKTFEEVSRAMFVKRSEIAHHDLKDHYESLKPVLDKLPKREYHQRSHVEKEILKYIKSPVEKYNLKDDSTFRSFINRGPWHFDVKDDVSNFVPTFTKNESSRNTWKRTLQFDSKLSPCNRMKRALNGFSDITNGLIDFTKTVDYSKSELEKASVERKDKIAKLHRKIQEQVARYNITGEDRENLNYIYKKAVRGDDDFTKRTDIAIQRSASKSLPLVRRQINSILRQGFGKNFYEMAEVLHGHAVDGYKRSGIPHAEDVKGETMLTNIKENLQDIVSSDGFDDDDEDDDGEVYDDGKAEVVPLPKRLASVKKDIVSMQSFANRCP